MMNKGKLTLIVSLLLVVLGVFGSLALVKRSQDLRKSAALVKTTIKLSSTTISGAVDSNVSVGIFIDTPRKVSTAKVKLCYGDALTTDVASVTNVGPLTVENSKTIENNCLIISKRVEASATIDQLPTGSFQFANVTFKIKKNGSLTISQTESLIAGEPVNNDVNIPIDEVVGATVTVGSGGVTGGGNGSSMIFESSDLTSKKVNENLSVKLYLNTTKNFDAAEVNFCYGDKLLLVDSGIVKGADFTDFAKKTISNNCLEYSVLATSKSLTGKVLLGTFSFKAVNTGSGTLVFDSVIKNFSNAVDGLMKVESTPSVNYTINSAALTPTNGEALVNIKLAFAGVKNNNGKCAKDNWLVKIKLVSSIHTASCSLLECGNCDADICSSMMGCTSNGNLCVSVCAGVTGTKCVGSFLYTCNNGKADSFPDICDVNGCDATNGKCNGVGETIPTFIGKVLSGYPTQTTSTNSRGEIIYDFSVTAAGVPDTGVNRSAFFLTGPKHISVKYGEDSQKRWYPNLVGALNLAKGTNSYDFSEYPLLAGDVTGDIAGTPDGKIDGRDYSYIKNKAVVLIAAAADGTNLDGDVNGDCQVNSGDVSLMVDSLKEINGQTY